MPEGLTFFLWMGVTILGDAILAYNLIFKDKSNPQYLGLLSLFIMVQAFILTPVLLGFALPLAIAGLIIGIIGFYRAFFAR